MNDWLDYKDSGSARAYSANGLMSDSNIEGLQNARNKLFYDRDLLKDTNIYKITM